MLDRKVVSEFDPSGDSDNSRCELPDLPSDWLNASYAKKGKLSDLSSEF